ncbi:hypothetical protein P5673_030529 [Acropora cervicornis]|uniref:Uncharacterized protein n=1 Tax=Acropora cervicornis TaxID=6130 RepID=A0AAD9UTB7_ACRCE|nr:hypothetical protein P5673_030529 [Acropora cervicornis]
MAVSGLHSSKRELKKNPELARKYRDVVNSYISKGHCTKLTPEERKKMSSRTWYLPHHAVLNPNKPGKVRVVFDAASRSRKIGIMAGVEQMLHQVGVCEEDRDSLHFLWRDLDETISPDEAVDSPCCVNYALQRTALDQSENFSEKAVHAVLRNFYMDDLLSSKPNSNGAANLAKQLISLLATEGFRLTKWMSNIPKVLAGIPSSEVAWDIVDLACSNLQQERAVGVKWDTEQDFLCLQPIITVSRWYGFQGVQLHVFCDASEMAYGIAVAYFWMISHGHVNVSFIMSKTRLALIKTLTIPQLELQAAVIAVRLKSKILTEVEVEDIYLWSESEIVLHYIRNTHRRFSIYVSHRVAEIVSTSDVKEWHHVPGSMNVAEDCTRGLEMCDLTRECW